MIYQGKAHKYGRDINTDVIIPARYLTTFDLQELGKHCMENLDPSFIFKIEKGDILVAEENFGCGSSREHAPLAIKAAGISCIIAKSFARIFFRNAINIGLPILECPKAVDGINTGDQIKVDTEKGQIINLSTGKIFEVKPFPDFIQEIIERGGLINYVKERLKVKG
ncbi:MAG: 3-isopropylmalate dehydratase small subunit [Actinomycetota bacterium]|nr:3-isopropylmalate dehydratase small subunit [Actinomycetota bacterium]MDI6821600.1 3-isopropylmalate dehydratase small subunit [Actinomycetota bacterium]